MLKSNQLTWFSIPAEASLFEKSDLTALGLYGFAVASTTSAPTPVPATPPSLKPVPSCIFLPLRLSVFLFSFTVSSALIDFKIEVNELICFALASTSFWVVLKASRYCLASATSFSAFWIWEACFLFPRIRSIWASKSAKLALNVDELTVSLSTLFTLFFDTSLVSGVSFVSATCGLVAGTTSSFVPGFSVSVPTSGAFSCFGSVATSTLFADWGVSPTFDITVAVSVFCSSAFTWSKL